MSTADMELVIDFEFLRGRQNEFVVKEISMAAKTWSPCSVSGTPSACATRLRWKWAQLGGRAHSLPRSVRGSERGGSGVRSPLCYGVTKCKLLTELWSRPILNLQDFKCPQTTSFNHKCWCSLPFHKFSYVNCATKTAHSFYDWLMFHLKTKSHVRCRKNMTRHTSTFFRLLKWEGPVGCPSVVDDGI